MTVAFNKIHCFAVVARSVLALMGLGLALLGSHFLKPPMLNEDVLVWVNHQPITLQDLSFSVKRLTQTSGDSLNTKSLQAILELLIDEELLLQRIESLEIQREDPGLKKQLVHAVIDKVVTDFLKTPVEDQQLLTFYRQHQMVFENSKRVAVTAFRFALLTEAQQARRSLLVSERPLNSIHTALLSHLPSSPLPAHMLRRYLGTTLASMVLELDQNDVTDLFHRPDGYYLVQVKHVIPAFVPEFEVIKKEVKAEYLRRGRDEALEKMLAILWVGANIDVNQSLIDPSLLSDKAELLLSAAINE
jgi:hypothetical protein